MQPKCPNANCGRIKTTRRLTDHEWWCTHCGTHFDPVDDGNVGRLSPDENAARKEEFIMRRQGRLPRKSRKTRQDD